MAASDVDSTIKEFERIATDFSPKKKEFLRTLSNSATALLSSRSKEAAEVRNKAEGELTKLLWEALVIRAKDPTRKKEHDREKKLQEEELQLVEAYRKALGTISGKKGNDLIQVAQQHLIKLLWKVLVSCAADFTESQKTQEEVKDSMAAYYTAFLRITGKKFIGTLCKADYFPMFPFFEEKKSSPEFNTIRGMLLWADTLRSTPEQKWLRQGDCLSKQLFYAPFWANGIKADDQGVYRFSSETYQQVMPEVFAIFKIAFGDKNARKKLMSLVIGQKYGEKGEFINGFRNSYDCILFLGNKGIGLSVESKGPINSDDPVLKYSLIYLPPSDAKVEGSEEKDSISWWPKEISEKFEEILIPDDNEFSELTEELWPDKVTKTFSSRTSSPVQPSSSHLASSLSDPLSIDKSQTRSESSSSSSLASSALDLTDEHTVNSFKEKKRRKFEEKEGTDTEDDELLSIITDPSLRTFTNRSHHAAKLSARGKKKSEFDETKDSTTTSLPLSSGEDASHVVPKDKDEIIVIPVEETKGVKFEEKDKTSAESGYKGKDRDSEVDVKSENPLDGKKELLEDADQKDETSTGSDDGFNSDDGSKKGKRDDTSDSTKRDSDPDSSISTEPEQEPNREGDSSQTLAVFKTEDKKLRDVDPDQEAIQQDKEEFDGREIDSVAFEGDKKADIEANDDKKDTEVDDEEKRKGDPSQSTLTALSLSSFVDVFPEPGKPDLIILPASSSSLPISQEKIGTTLKDESSFSGDRLTFLPDLENSSKSDRSRNEVSADPKSPSSKSKSRTTSSVSSFFRGIFGLGKKEDKKEEGQKQVTFKEDNSKRDEKPVITHKSDNPSFSVDGKASLTLSSVHSMTPLSSPLSLPLSPIQPPKDPSSSLSMPLDDRFASSIEDDNHDDPFTITGNNPGNPFAISIKDKVSFSNLGTLSINPSMSPPVMNPVSTSLSFEDHEKKAEELEEIPLDELTSPSTPPPSSLIGFFSVPSTPFTKKKQKKERTTDAEKIPTATSLTSTKLIVPVISTPLSFRDMGKIPNAGKKPVSSDSTPPESTVSVQPLSSLSSKTPSSSSHSAALSSDVLYEDMRTYLRAWVFTQQAVNAKEEKSTIQKDVQRVVDYYKSENKSIEERPSDELVKKILAKKLPPAYIDPTDGTTVTVEEIKPSKKMPTQAMMFTKKDGDDQEITTSFIETDDRTTNVEVLGECDRTGGYDRVIDETVAAAEKLCTVSGSNVFVLDVDLKSASKKDQKNFVEVEAKYCNALLRAHIVPVLFHYEKTKSSTAIWETFKSLSGVDEKNKDKDKPAPTLYAELYLNTILNEEDKSLRKELITAFYEEYFRELDSKIKLTDLLQKENRQIQKLIRKHVGRTASTHFGEGSLGFFSSPSFSFDQTSLDSDQDADPKRPPTPRSPFSPPE